MEIYQYGMDDKLIIKSDRANMELVIIYLVFLVLIDIGTVWTFGISLNIFTIFIILLSVFLIKTALYEWIGINRTLIMEKDGCTVCFYRYRKFYAWDKLAIKRWENYSDMVSDVGVGYEKAYYEGVFFSRDLVDKPKKITPNAFFRIRWPLTCFCVNFYPYGITKGYGDYSERRSTDSAFILKRAPEVYPIDKEVFVNYMKLWEVDIEGLSMDTENIKYVK